MKNEEILKENNGKKFDIVLMNPPYLGANRNDYNIHLKFLNKVNEITDKVVSIQPIMFLYKTYERKSPEQAEKTILGTIKEHGCNVEEVKGTEFDTAFGNKIGIISIDLVNKNDIIVNNKKYDSTSQINKFSHDDLIVEFNNIVKPLYKKDSLIKHWCWTDKRNIDSVKRKEEDSKSNKWFVNVASIRGNKGTDDMYTIIPRDRKVEFGERTLNFYINFDTKEEGENFINYCKTDFASMCIYFHKEDINLGTNLHYVPWFDFSDEHFSKSPREIDDWLFKKYNISDEIRKHIEEILPDYYGIRNIK